MQIGVLKLPLDPPGRTVANAEWSGWGDRDDPDPTSDDENIDMWISHRDGHPCSGTAPLAAECRVVGTRRVLTHNETHGRLELGCGVGGLICRGTESDSCLDYEVRYACPAGALATIWRQIRVLQHRRRHQYVIFNIA